MDIAYSIAGFAVGIVVGLTGVGGGSLMTPLLVLGFGVPAVTAVGTDLLFAGITKSGGAAAHGLRDHVDWRVAAWLAAGSIPGAAVALAALAWWPAAARSSGAIVSTALGFMLVLTALALVLRTPLVAWARAQGERGLLASHRDAATIAIGLLIGVAVTLSSVGAGAVGVTALALLYPTLGTVRTVGTDIAHAIPIALVAGLGHAALGHVDWVLLATLLAGSVPGIVLGTHLAAQLPERLVRHSLAAILLFAGGRLVVP
jgi:hypothetical protein